MKRIITLLSLLLLLPAVMATSLSVVSPVSSNSVLEYSGNCNSAGSTVGVQISFMGNLVHFDQLTSSPNFASSSSSTPYTPTTDGEYSISASCAGEASASATVCVGSNCPTGESSNGDSSSGSSGGGSERPLVVVGSSKDSSSTDESTTSTSSRKTQTKKTDYSASSGKDQDDTEDDIKDGSSGLLITLLILALLIGGGYFLWKKYKKPQGYAPMPQTQ